MAKKKISKNKKDTQAGRPKYSAKKTKSVTKKNSASKRLSKGLAQKAKSVAKKKTTRKQGSRAFAKEPKPVQKKKTRRETHTAQRRRVPASVINNILIKSRRRCCFCFGLNSDDTQKAGQIAHLDRNVLNHNEDICWSASIAYPFSVPIVARKSGYSWVMAFWPALANSPGAYR